MSACVARGVRKVSIQNARYCGRGSAASENASRSVATMNERADRILAVDCTMPSPHGEQAATRQPPAEDVGARAVESRPRLAYRGAAAGGGGASEFECC